MKIFSFTEFINESLGKAIRVFVDLDGVLADFDRGFRNLVDNHEKLSADDYEKKYGKDQFWALISKNGESFYENLAWKSDGRVLWDYIKRYRPIVLTSPSQDKTSVTGKTKWVRRYLLINEDPVMNPKYFQQGHHLIIDGDKYKYASFETDILIDDTEEKIKKWTEAGGTGILHTESKSTIQLLEQVIEKLMPKKEKEEDL